jgi:hypothetical protein
MFLSVSVFLKTRTRVDFMKRQSSQFCIGKKIFDFKSICIAIAIIIYGRRCIFTEEELLSVKSGVDILN